MRNANFIKGHHITMHPGKPRLAKPDLAIRESDHPGRSFSQGD
jgi:hypothetical protein